MSLDTLRKLRGRAQDAITMELAHITQELIRLERQCELLEEQIRSKASAYQLQAARGLVVADMLEWLGTLESKQTVLQQTRIAISQLTEAWTGTQGRLIEAARDCKMLDRLAERQREAQEAEIRRREQQATDEAAGRLRVSSRTGVSWK